MVGSGIGFIKKTAEAFSAAPDPARLDHHRESLIEMFPDLLFGFIVLEVSYVVAWDPFFLQDNRNTVKGNRHLPCHWFPIIFCPDFFREDIFFYGLDLLVRS